MSTAALTFLFTDIEGSTRLWEREPEKAMRLLERHNALIANAVSRHNGRTFKTVGDAFCVVFADAAGAVNGAVDAQKALQQMSEDMRVRMALHSGSAEERDGDFFGPTLNRVARLLAAAHGGQILATHATWELARDALQGITCRELGQHRLKDLLNPLSIVAIIHAGLPADFPPIRTMNAAAHNLPLQLTNFIGREAELRDVAALVESSRLVTLAGAGGSGKTRLALHVAADALQPFENGVWLAELAGATSPETIARAVATALGIREEPGLPVAEAIVDWLRGRTVLLVLDNCEHVAEACARLAGEVLIQCPGVKVLATSREPLGLPGETVYRVPSLSLPVSGDVTPAQLADAESVRLFVDRARLAQPSFVLNGPHAPAVAAICLRLEGIPLAVELAAARVAVISPEQIAARLDDAFRVLSGGSTAGLPRHQTMRAAIQWSHDMLSEPEKALFRRLAVFVGGWTLAAAEAVCADEHIAEADVLDLLAALVSKSLVVFHAEQERYRYLETVHQFGVEELKCSGEERDVRERHLDFFTQLASDAAANLTGAAQADSLNRLESEQPNVLAALTHCEAAPGGGRRAFHIVACLPRFWEIRGHWSTGLSVIHHVLERFPDETGPDRAKALAGAGLLATHLGDLPLARRHHEDAMAISREAGDPRGVGLALNNLGNIARQQSDYAEAEGKHQEALALFRDAGDRTYEAACLNSLGNIAYQKGDLARAAEMYSQVLAVRSEMGDKHGVALALNNLGITAVARGENQEARRLYEQALEVRREIGDKLGIARTLGNLAVNVCETGDHWAAGKLLDEAIALYRDLGDALGVAVATHNLGHVALEAGDMAGAKRYYAQGLALCREAGGPREVAVCLSNLGLAEYQLGKTGEAREHLESALSMQLELGNKSGLGDTLGAMVGLAVVAGDRSRAAWLVGACDRIEEETGSALSANRRRLLDAQIEAVRAALGEERFAEARSEGRAAAWDQAGAAALVWIQTHPAASVHQTAGS